MSEPLRDRESEPAGRLDAWTDLDPGYVARQVHSLHSLLELSHELKVTLGLHETVDLLLFNLMGQFGTGRSAMWLFSNDAGAPSVMVRCRGFKPQAVSAVYNICEEVVRQRMLKDPSPILSWGLRGGLGDSEFELLERVGIALFAPLAAHDKLLGLLVLGERVSRGPYTGEDLQTLQAALGMVGMSLQNSRLYSRVLENNRQLRLDHDRLLEHDRLKSEFLSNVNHELRTPLAVIIGTLECIVDHSAVKGDLQKLVEGGLVKAHDLRRLIENLLVLGEGPRGRIEIQSEIGDLGALLTDFYVERLGGISDSLREFRLECGSLPAARFDRRVVTQILNELVDNAIKFTPRGACLRLCADRLEEDGRHWAMIEVSDDGPGIPADRLDSLFHSFEQLDGSATRRVGGMGVGLAFARQMAQRMDGVLRARSTPGAGSTFTLLLPAA